MEIHGQMMILMMTMILFPQATVKDLQTPRATISVHYAMLVKLGNVSQGDFSERFSNGLVKKKKFLSQAFSLYSTLKNDNLLKLYI